MIVRVIPNAQFPINTHVIPQKVGQISGVRVMGWQPTTQPGGRYREHKTRKFRGRPDKYYSIRYKKDGKTKEEVVGWFHESINVQKASALRLILVDNIRNGRHPQSLKEMRDMDIERVEIELKEAKRKDALSLTLDTVAQEYLAGLKPSVQKANTSRYNNHIKPVFGDVPLRKIDPLSLERFKRNLMKKLVPKTVHHTLTVIRTIYRRAVAWEHYNGSIPTSKVDGLVKTQTSRYPVIPA